MKLTKNAIKTLKVLFSHSPTVDREFSSPVVGRTAFGLQSEVLQITIKRRSALFLPVVWVIYLNSGTIVIRVISTSVIPHKYNKFKNVS
jgi:hypothetical protein